MSFEKQLANFNKITAQELDKEVRNIANNVYAQLTKITPVATGLAEGNWNLSVGRPDRTVTELGSDGGVMANPPPTLRQGDGKKPIYITNSLYYIIYLEGGHSKQAPNGMVRVVMTNFNNPLMESINSF